MAFLDIIVPVYNVENFLVKCLDSIYKQNFSDYKVILIDDGSTDKSGKICDVFKNKHKNTLVIHKKNEGLSIARNTGLRFAKSEYVTFLDADDYLSPNALEFAFKEAKKYNNPDLFVFNLKRESVFGETINENIIPIKNIILSKKEYFKSLLLNYIYVISCSKLIKRNIFDNIKFNPHKLHEDEFIIHKIIDECRTNIYCYSYVFYHYVDRKGSIVNQTTFSNHTFDGIVALVERSIYFRKNRYFINALKTYFFVIEKYNLLKKAFGNTQKIAFKNLKKYISHNYYCKNKINYEFIVFLSLIRKIKNSLRNIVKQ